MKDSNTKREKTGFFLGASVVFFPFCVLASSLGVVVEVNNQPRRLVSLPKAANISTTAEHPCPCGIYCYDAIRK